MSNDKDKVLSEEELILNNMGLIGWILQNRINAPDAMKKMNCEWEDLYSIGTIALIKAAKSYNRDTRFSTFAIKCITNTFFMEIRKTKAISRTANIISLDSPVSEEEEGATIKDIIGFRDDRFIEIELKLSEQSILDKVNRSLSDREKKILACKCKGLNQAETGRELKISQSYISRLFIVMEQKLKMIHKEVI